MIGDWGEVVTRYPYRKVGMDHLLSRSTSSLELGHFRSNPRVRARAKVGAVEKRSFYAALGRRRSPEDRFLWSPTPQFSGVFALGALPDIWIDEQDHRKIAKLYFGLRLRPSDLETLFPSSPTYGCARVILAIEPSSTISVDRMSRGHSTESQKSAKALTGESRASQARA